MGGTVGGADGDVAVRVCVRTRMCDTTRGGRGCGRDRVCWRTYMCMRACVHGYGAAASPLPHLGARMFSLLIYLFARLLSPHAHILPYRLSIFAHLTPHLFTLFAPLAPRPLFLPTYLLARLHAHLDAQLDAPPPQPAHPPRNLLPHPHARPSPTSSTGRDGRRHGGIGRRACGHRYLCYGVRTVLPS